MLGRLAPAAVAAALLAAAVPAVAAASPGIGAPTSFKAAFTTHHPGHASGLRLRTTGALPIAPVTEAPALRQTITFPRGTRLRLGRLPQCHADLAALESMGAEAVCPASTRVGHGRAEGVAAGAPVGFDLAIYAVDGRLSFAAERDGMPLKAGFFGIAHGRRLALSVPTSNGAIAPTLFRATIARTGGWLRTPSTCPPSGHWTAHARFQGLTAVGGTPVGAGRTLAEHLSCHR